MSDVSNVIVDWRARRVPSPKRKLFTPAVLQQVARWVASGQSAEEIAERIGCTPGTLKVRCSHEGISLRRHRPAGEVVGKPKRRRSRVSVQVPGSIFAVIEARAAPKGMTGAALATSLLAKIVTDDLFEAVLDDDAPSVCVDDAPSVARLDDVLADA